MALYLNDLGMLSASGSHPGEMLQRLQAGDRSGLMLTNQYSASDSVYVGEINTELPKIDPQYKVYDCKNNRLLLAALEQIKDTVDAVIRRYGSTKVGVVLGTSTSGVRNTELALRAVAKTRNKPESFHYKQQQLAAGADFLAYMMGVKGPAYVISTACSSSGNALASARRLIEIGCCDAVIVGGADSLCRFTVHGFDALESVSKGLCKPFGQHRDGINLSEAVALFVLSREQGPVQLRGIGASSDAYHFSAPDPDAKAVMMAMSAALKQAELTAEQVDYVNLHGTATALNDAMESKAVQQVMGEQVAVSSSKGMTGHALGAAAALELGICWMLLNQTDEQGHLVPNINDDELDHQLPALNFVQPGEKLGHVIKVCQSNSFAFGGSNVSIVVSKT